MKSISQFVAVSLMPPVVSGCMCMMPMNDMSMKEKEYMGMNRWASEVVACPWPEQR